MKKYLLLSQMQIQNANAMSSTCTIGFPAMTAWQGIRTFHRYCCILP